RIGDVLARLPLDRVWEVHLAGLEFAHGHWLDAHAGGIDDELIAIAGEVVVSLPNVGAILFEISSDRLADFGERGLLREMERLHRLWEQTRPGSPAKTALGRSFAETQLPEPKAWERLIASRMLPEHDRPSGGEGE